MRRHLVSALTLLALVTVAACSAITAPPHTTTADEGTDQQITVGPHPRAVTPAR